LPATITRGVRDCLAVAAAASHARCHQGVGLPNPYSDYGGATAENKLLVASSAASVVHAQLSGKFALSGVIELAIALTSD
jgi:hypothetical protein